VPIESEARHGRVGMGGARGAIAPPGLWESLAAGTPGSARGNGQRPFQGRRPNVCLAHVPVSGVSEVATEGTGDA